MLNIMSLIIGMIDLLLSTQVRSRQGSELLCAKNMQKPLAVFLQPY